MLVCLSAFGAGVFGVFFSFLVVIIIVGAIKFYWHGCFVSGSVEALRSLLIFMCMSSVLPKTNYSHQTF